MQVDLALRRVDRVDRAGLTNEGDHPALLNLEPNRDVAHDGTQMRVASHHAIAVVDLPAAKHAAGQKPVAEVGRAGPDFLLETPQGGTLRLSDLQGQPVLLNFWATWCPPCREEMPELVAAYERYQAQGLVIVAVNLQEADEKVLDFAREFGLAFPIVIDRSSQVGEVWRLGGPVKGIPSSYFIDASGVIRSLYYGPMPEQAIEDGLAKILPPVTSESGG